MPHADLEISLYRRDAAGDGANYGVELRFNDPQNEADQRHRGSNPLHFDAAELRARELDPAATGQYLADQLLGEKAVQNFFNQAVTATQAQSASLRIRLAIQPNATELHSCHWETLQLRGMDAPLLTGQNVTFSRYLSSLDWRPVPLRPEGDARALVVVANPSDLAQWGLTPVDGEQELNTARRGLSEVEVSTLAARGEATLHNIAERLREGCDILFLVAHGVLANGEPWLFLECETGTTKRVPGSELVTRIQELEDRPRLVILLSCQSAGTGDVEPAPQDGGALAALGPRLAEAGVPAVIAMQGNISMETASTFMATFFQELRRDRQVDRAVSVARGAVRDRPDWWMPVLFMRLKSGRIGYKPGFSMEAGGLQKWPALVRNIQAGRCTPIVGPGLTESLLGSRQKIAARWAETFRYPMNPNNRESLPQVAQFLKVRQDVNFMRDELSKHLLAEIKQRFGKLIAPELADASLDEVITAVGRSLAKNPATAAIRTLASLPLPIYVTTNPSNLLAEALEAAGKQPVVELCRWNDAVEQIPSIFDAEREPDYRPTPRRPLVYHLFGRLSQPDSLVITEDDYFDYLIGVTSRNDLIPAVVRRALADSALLFLGFDLDEWDFRVLFRTLMLQEGGRARDNYAHVAAQIDPESGRIIEPEGARRYLAEYFGQQTARISIFWGSVADFGCVLDEQLRQAARS